MAIVSVGGCLPMELNYYIGAGDLFLNLFLF